MEAMQKQWGRFMVEMQKSQQVISQLSKLYIILHENVRKTILKCTIDLQYDPSYDAEQHLTKILDLLHRLNNPNDVYLRDVDPKIISKYQEQLIDLSDQIQKLVKTQRTAKNNDPKQLEGIKHINNSQKFGLKDQLKQSQQRILRSKSGKRKIQTPQNNKAFSNDLIDEFDSYKKQYLLKKSKLQKQMDKHIQTKNNQVLFKNKYTGTNLQNYFKLRKELLDLLLAQQHTQNIINYPQQLEVNDKNIQNEAIEQKLFSQFKIKTKFMKSKVKENILNALAQVKMKLLHQYHVSNVKKLTDGNPDTLISLAHEKKKKRAIERNTSNPKHLASAQRFQQLQRKSKSIHHMESRSTIVRYPMALKTSLPLVYQSGWTEQIENQHRKTLSNRLSQGRVPNTARK